MEGVLWKWTNYLSGWQPRWFVLDNGILSYYKSQEDVNNGCKGSIKMSACDISVHHSDSTRLDLIIPGEQRYYVKAANYQERQAWLVALGSSKAAFNSSQNRPESGEMSPDIIKYKKSELRLYCDLMMQQVHSVKEIATVEGGTINQEKLTEASHLLGATCDTFIQTLEDCMNLVSTMPVYEMPHQHIMDSAIPLSPAHGRIKRGIIPTPSPRQRTHSDSSHSDTPGPEHSMNGPVRNRPLLKEEDAIPEQPVEIVVTKVDNSVQSSTSKQTVSSEDLDSPEDFQDAIDSKIPTFFSTLNQSFTPEDVMSPDGIIVSLFLEACHNILPLFVDKLNSTAFAPVKMDFTGNIRKIRQKYSSKPEEFTTLQRIVCNEIKANQHTSSNSATVAILWLNRGLEFIREILREVNSGEMDLSKCAYGAYDRTLKPYHGWVVRGIFAVAVKALPYRDDFLTHLAVTDCDIKSPIFIHSLQEDIEDYVKNLDQTIQVIHQFYKDHDLNNEDPI
ncbi:hypothetical protein LOTGIDRAFT_140459 [Lottia gigantea]|uniref:Pleckstrin homology domain-containing family A member 8 n=1 Tax=Lottia gigantea TaxID=225164 RepID=V4AA68_LOTGI|nr:hypothetical protein LOTGIDRAFT_140459 [Lottia gigantea]ESP00844.1 hypothetical protein LOTGIDRAFT_140459 [Lottia gigantea]